MHFSLSLNSPFDPHLSPLFLSLDWRSKLDTITPLYLLTPITHSAFVRAVPLVYSNALGMAQDGRQFPVEHIS